MRRVWPWQLALGAALVALGWGSTLAQAAPLSWYWFQIVWTGWLLAADAVVLARHGRSLLHGPPGRLAALFALSSAVWWAYEMLNWHLRNWVYLGAEHFTTSQRVALKTLAFSTVLPAVAVTRDLVWSLTAGRRARPPAPEPPPAARPRGARWMIGLGLAGALALWLFPRQAFPLVWVSPFLLLDGVAHLRGRPSALGLVAAGQGRRVWLVALAGLATGVLWELWNWGADPHWEYLVPYVGFWRVFEMPLLGYGGYLPFALTCDALVRTVFGGRGELVDGPVTDLGQAPEAARISA
jgi:hypothetical protein